RRGSETPTSGPGHLKKCLSGAGSKLCTKTAESRASEKSGPGENVRASLGRVAVQSPSRKMPALLVFERIAQPGGERIQVGALAEGVSVETEDQSRSERVINPLFSSVSRNSASPCACLRRHNMALLNVGSNADSAIAKDAEQTDCGQGQHKEARPVCGRG